MDNEGADRRAVDAAQALIEAYGKLVIDVAKLLGGVDARVLGSQGETPLESVARIGREMVARVVQLRTGEAFSPERAEQVVSEIEAGIRKLAGILSSEVNEQWKKAESAFHEVVGLRGRTEQAYQNTSAMLAQIAHLKEEMEIARDDAEVARREAKLLRDDARRAKERAEAAAAACATVGGR